MEMSANAGGGSTMKIFINDVLYALSHMTYRLPKADELISQLSNLQLNGMQVAMQRYADFVTGDFGRFLTFVRRAGIRTVMFSYVYYTPEEIEEMFKLSDSDKALFYSPYHQPQPHRGRSRSKAPDDFYSGYGQYIQYSKFIRANLDLCHPKELRMYVVHEGRIIAFQQADLWLIRMGLMDRTAIRQYAMENNVGANSLMFDFTNQ